MKIFVINILPEKWAFISMHEILDTHTSTTFLPSHVTTDYNPTTAQQTGIYKLLLCNFPLNSLINTILFPQYDNNYPTLTYCLFIHILNILNIR